ncbi:AI-2E family transporter [Lacticaseibacillus saniviri]|uniref:Membrane protein n=2 Tax=Lacticaseibacillus saniviri TaxID=931533 RepID=A0A0R2MP92_9LACO|nr:AI-2E family transporter [Lacticaseibacillus saniviri]KRO15476.1 membrane protein [Lacticaseibacillus saniviri JCM 17471 = DSM 24301]MCG4281319.1 AI-2E family transporter [Lacticaseibacillus saniviri]
MEKQKTWFYRRFLNNKFAVVMFDLILVLLAILLFTKIAWVFEPVVTFLGVVAPPFLLAGILFYLTVPIINWMEAKLNFKRGLAILLLFIVLIGLLAWGIFKFVPAVQQQATSIIQSWPTLWKQFTDWLTELNSKQNLISQKDLNHIGQEIMSAFSGKQSSILSGTVSQIQNVIGIVGNVVVTISTAPIILFFMLKDGDQFVPNLLPIFPTKARASIGDMLTEMNTKVGSYVQGQLTVALAVAIIFMIGYSVIGLKYALVLGLIAGPLNLIPYFGSALAMVPSLIMGLLTSPKMLIAVIIVFFIEWLLETQLISPLVMGSKLEMHPITIVVVLLTAGNLFGLLGVILGIPGFAVIKIIVSRFFAWYQTISGLYDDPEPDDDATPPVPTQKD